MILPLVVALLQGAVQSSAPQVSARLIPEEVGVGAAVTVELRVRAAADADVRFPAMPDSSDQVEPLDPRMLRDNSTSALLDRTAVYRLIAWDTGSKPLRFGDITVVSGGRERRYRVSLPVLRVHSVLPVDTLSRKPRAARALLLIPGWWWRLAVGGVVVLVLAWFSWRAWRRRADRNGVRVDPAGSAAVRFAHAERLGLLEAGEPGRFALAHIEVMRDFIAARFPQAARSLTGRELVTALAGAEFPILPERVTDLIVRCEPIAFAAAPVPDAEARAIAVEARAIVGDVETAWRTRAAMVAPKPRRKRK